MDVLISLSTASAYFYSVYNLFNDIHIYYFESLCVIIGVILLGKYIENKLKTKKIGSITNLLRYKPKKVLLFKGNEIKEVDIQSLKEGDIIELKNGACFYIWIISTKDKKDRSGKGWRKVWSRIREIVFKFFFNFNLNLF
jgi:magnesium-transporting ATPase (P-type)